jgi:hypothetical protein
MSASAFSATGSPYSTGSTGSVSGSPFSTGGSSSGGSGGKLGFQSGFPQSSSSKGKSNTFKF